MKISTILLVQLAYYPIEMDTVDLNLFWKQCLLKEKAQKSNKGPWSLKQNARRKAHFFEVQHTIYEKLENTKYMWI